MSWAWVEKVLDKAKLTTIALTAMLGGLFVYFFNIKDNFLIYAIFGASFLISYFLIEFLLPKIISPSYPIRNKNRKILILKSLTEIEIFLLNEIIKVIDERLIRNYSVPLELSRKGYIENWSRLINSEIVQTSGSYRSEVKYGSSEYLPMYSVHEKDEKLIRKHLKRALKTSKANDFV